MRFHIWDPASSHNITHLFTWQNSLNVYVPVSEVGTWSIAQRLKFNTETKTALSNRELTAREVTESEEVQYEKCSVLWEWVEETQPRPRMHAIFLEKTLNIMPIYEENSLQQILSSLTIEISPFDYTNIIFSWWRVPEVLTHMTAFIHKAIWTSLKEH